MGNMPDFLGFCRLFVWRIKKGSRDWETANIKYIAAVYVRCHCNTENIHTSKLLDEK